uniref:Elongation factor G n=1 Tax=Eufriesea mexicana TaxID=516756 RepID=A0A310SL45_9HYME
MDKNGTDFDHLIQTLKDRLGTNAHAIQCPIGAQDAFDGIINIIEMKAYHFDGEPNEDYKEIPIPEELKDTAEIRSEVFFDALSHFDEDFFTKYAEGKELKVAGIKIVIRKATIADKFFPVLYGGAFKNKGVKLMLNAAIDYLPSPLDVTTIKGILPATSKGAERHSCDEEPFSALALKLMTDTFDGRLFFFTVYLGKLESRSYVSNSTKEKKNLMTLAAAVASYCSKPEASGYKYMFKDYVLLMLQVAVLSNNCDMESVNDNVLELVEVDIRELLTKYEFEGDDTTIIRGFARGTLDGKKEEVDKPVLSAVEDVFTITGRGTVATGRIERGTLKVNDEIDTIVINIGRKKVVVTRIEMFRKLLDEAQAGSITPCTKFEGEVYILTDQEGRRHISCNSAYRPKFYFRGIDVTGIMEDFINEGERSQLTMLCDYVTITVGLIHPVALEKGQHLVIPLTMTHGNTNKSFEQLLLIYLEPNKIIEPNKSNVKILVSAGYGYPPGTKIIKSEMSEISTLIK